MSAFGILGGSSGGWAPRLAPCLAATGVPPGVWIAAAAVFLVLLWFFGNYNGLVSARNECLDAWAKVETELQRRYDLIPNLVEAVKAYAAHEREVLRRVVEARNRAAANHGSPESQARDENAFVGLLRRVFVLAEGYPQLRASENFLALQRELVTTEDRIQRARRFYNGNARELANRVEVFPTNLLAAMFGFQRVEFFEIEEGARARPDVSGLTN
jgi:LemA protein